MYRANVLISKSSGSDVYCKCSLSTANNSESDADLTVGVRGDSGYIWAPAFTEKFLTLAAKATYYLNQMTSSSSVTELGTRGDYGKTIIRAVCAYL
jgi:hypothetical protein